ncbi:MAG: dihydrodipicolinate synthase family protein [Bifidobacterium sp.]|uniref:dihydrodipicolinate synthase family protein n=1 Tax=Bifidobacterium sp. TaxID=41200 RepID=UPI0039EB8C6C
MRKPEIITAAIAAFGPDGQLDEGMNRAFLERVEPYSDGVLAVGTTAEFPSLSFEERRMLIRIALEVFGPDRTIAHVGAPSVMQAKAYAQAAMDLGARRFAAITPYYLTASQHGVVGYYQALRDCIEGELYAYVFPDVACTDVAAETLAQLQELGLDGVKLSGAASTRLEEYRQAAPQLKLWSGNDADVPHILAVGGLGTVSGVSGVAPMSWAELRKAYESDDDSRIAQSQGQIEELVSVLGPSISRLKYALAVLGVNVGNCRMPIDEPDSQMQAKIRELLASAHISE